MQLPPPPSAGCSEIGSAPACGARRATGTWLIDAAECRDNERSPLKPRRASLLDGVDLSGLEWNAKRRFKDASGEGNNPTLAPAFLC